MKTEQDTTHDVLIVIPTMGDPSLIIPAVDRVLRHNDEHRLHLLPVFNPNTDEQEPAAQALHQITSMVEIHNAMRDDEDEHVTLTIKALPGPAGWTGAVNAGIRTAIEGKGLPEMIVVMNDDLLVTPCWLQNMNAALLTDRVYMNGEIATLADACFETDGRDAASYGKIGMVGPVSANVAGAQRVMPPEAKLGSGFAFEIDSGQQLDAFAREYAATNVGRSMSTSFLSGFCVGYRRECLEDLLLDLPAGPALCDPCFGIGGFDDNDVSVRANKLEWQMVIALDTYVHHLGHRTLNRVFPEQQRGMVNAATFLDKWRDETSREQRLVACYRVCWDTPWDVNMLAASIDRVAQLVDGIALLFTNNPNDVHKHPEFKLGELAPPEAELIASTGDDYPDKEAALLKWLEQAAAKVEHDVAVTVQYRDRTKHEWNERDDRNASIELAHTLNPDWIISVDADEVPEDRISREYMQRLMNHPNPMVSLYDFGWVNHWDTPRVMRVDQPWADEYRSNMRGFRMWRVRGERLITGGTERGLHCGNSPDFSDAAKRVSGMRFRHFGYIRATDRVRKFHRYTRLLDPSPDQVLTGGGYTHLMREEGMKLSPYIANNGIAFTMLLHAGENSVDLYRILDTLYSLVDRIVLVWTDECDIPADMQTISDAFGAEWFHSAMQENASLAACRNAALDHIQDTGQGAIRWCLTLDPDEHFESDFRSAVALRRMAEVSDSFGWMFQFRNYRPNGEFNFSETVRMFMLDQRREMRFEGRVHEKLEGPMNRMQARGMHPQIRYAPFVINHFGLSKTVEQMQDKLDRYTGLLIDAIRDEPNNCGHWTALGLQFGNDAQHEEQSRCFAIARECAGTAYLPHKVTAHMALRQARRCYEDVLTSLSVSHPYRKEAERIAGWLKENAPDMPVSGNASQGNPTPPDVPLDELVQHFRDFRAMREQPASGTVVA